MRQHKFIQSTKMFDEDVTNQKLIMEKHKLPAKTGGSKAIRIALQSCVDSMSLHEAILEQSKQIEALSEQVQQLYFMSQGGGR